MFTSILTNGSINTVFQPIVSLETGIVFGYEALSRISIPACDINIQDLFQIAQNQDRLWDLEKLCRTKALQNAVIQPTLSTLFLNVDANIIHDSKFRMGFTVEKLREYGICADRVVIEITEQSATQDMNNFISSVQHYQSQGFQIAIDDFGSGYSGLNRVCELSPNFLKIDIDLIRDINSDPLKRYAVGSTVDFCRKAGIQVIAEGIETEEELKAVIQLGVEFGQGYYLCQPNPKFQEIKSNHKYQICELFHKNGQKHFFSPLGKIGDLGIERSTATKSSSPLTLYEMMMKNSEISEFFILNNNKHVCGILTRYQIFEKFGGQFGYVLSKRMNIEDMMLKEVMIVDEHMPLEKVSEIAMQRSAHIVYDSIAVTRNGQYLSTVSIKELLLNSIRLQLQRATDANPLTNLPGNHEIQHMIEPLFRQTQPWAIIYFDIDNFKAYNDAYGFVSGDAMLKSLANTMRQRVGENDFLGHIGGDDFVIISSTHEVEELCWGIIKDFHSAIETLYSSVDWEQGFIVSKDRNGFTQNFDIATLSVAVVTNQAKKPQSPEELSALIAQTKKECKKRQGDAIVMV